MMSSVWDTQAIARLALLVGHGILLVLYHFFSMRGKLCCNRQLHFRYILLKFILRKLSKSLFIKLI